MRVVITFITFLGQSGFDSEIGIVLNLQILNKRNVFLLSIRGSIRARRINRFMYVLLQL